MKLLERKGEEWKVEIFGGEGGLNEMRAFGREGKLEWIRRKLESEDVDMTKMEIMKLRNEFEEDARRTIRTKVLKTETPNTTLIAQDMATYYGECWGVPQEYTRCE